MIDMMLKMSLVLFSVAIAIALLRILLGPSMPDHGSGRSVLPKLRQMTMRSLSSFRS